MGDQNTAPAEAYAPDPDRDDPDAPALMPRWVAYLIALVILFVIEQFQALAQRHVRRPAARRNARPALSPASDKAPAAATHIQPNQIAARTRGGDAVAPECADLSQMRAALLEKLRQSCAEPAVWSQLEALGVVPGPIGPDAAATPAAPMRATRRDANIRRAAPRRLSGNPRQAPRRHLFARAGTGPPTGPPAVSRLQSSYA